MHGHPISFKEGKMLFLVPHLNLWEQDTHVNKGTDMKEDFSYIMNGIYNITVGNKVRNFKKVF